MSPQYGELRPTSGWDRLTSLVYPCKFQLVSRIGSVTARHLVAGVSQTLLRWTEGATYIRQGDHHVGHWPTFLVFHVSLNSSKYLSPVRPYDRSDCCDRCIVETTRQPLTTLSWPRGSFLHQTCIAGLVEHLSPYTECNSDSTAFAPSPETTNIRKLFHTGCSSI